MEILGKVGEVYISREGQDGGVRVDPRELEEVDVIIGMRK